MQALKLTQDVVKGLEPADNRYEVKDKENRHLVVRVTPSGRKTFAYLRRVNGKLHRRTIGEFPEVSVSRARDEAFKKDGLVASGEPLEPKTLDVLTFGALFDKYLKEHAKPYKSTWQEDKRTYDKFFSHLAERRADSVTRSEVRDLHQTVSLNNGPYMAKRALAVLRKLYNFAIDRELLYFNPTTRIRTMPDKSRERFLLPDELQRFFKAVEDPELSGWRDFFLLLLYTGQRRSNVQAMKWDNVDLTSGIWHIPGKETKNEKPYAVPLVPPAVDILKERRDEITGAWVFPGKTSKGHIVEPKGAWAKLCKKAKLHNLRMHDLRRTMGSYQAAGNTSLQIIGQSLGHQSIEATQVYSRLQLGPVREAMEQAVETMEKSRMSGQKSIKEG